MSRIILVALFSLFTTNAMAIQNVVEVDSQDCDGAVGTCTENGHTSGGPGTMTLVFQTSDDSTATDRDTGGCTMNGKAMTRVSDNEVIGGSVEADLFYTINGPPGSVITCLWGGTITGGGMITVTLNGVSLFSQPDVVAENSTTGNTVIQQSLTTVKYNDILIDFVSSANGSVTFTGDAGQEEIMDTSPGGLSMASSIEYSSSPTSYTQGQTSTISAAMAYKVIAIRPYVDGFMDMLE